MDELGDLVDLLDDDLTRAREETIELAKSVKNLQKNNASDVLHAIEEQGYIDLSHRWRLGESNSGNGDLIFLDKVSSRRSGQSSYYRF